MEDWVPLTTILSADQNSPFYNEKDKAGSLYNESWALMHMLFLSGEYRPGFLRFMAAIEVGTPSEEALTRTYGKPLAAIEKDLQKYSHREGFQGALFPAKLENVAGEMPAQPLAAFDVHLVLAELMDWPGKETDARRALQALIVEDPKRPEPYVVRGYLALRKGDPGAAQDDFAKAFDLGDRTPRLLWDYGRMVERDDAPLAMEVFRELLLRESNRVDTRLELAALQLASKQAEAALVTLAYVQKVTPADAPRLFHIMAVARLLRGEREEARNAAERWAKFAKTTEDKAESERFITYLKENRPEAAKPEDALASDTPGIGDRPTLRRRETAVEQAPQVERAAERPSVTGAFVELNCIGKQAKVVIETGGVKRTFLVEDPVKITVIRKNSDAADLICGRQKPVKVRVEYDPPPAGGGVDGLLRLIYFEP
jgi:Tfp pilus assembly protein PilF